MAVDHLRRVAVIFVATVLPIPAAAYPSPTGVHFRLMEACVGYLSAELLRATLLGVEGAAPAYRRGVGQGRTLRDPEP